jgi:hypothetical protein
LKVAANFADISCEGYKNVNDLAVVQSRLHSSQTLFGDTNAEILVLLQDSANWETFEECLKQDQDFFRHHPNRITNKRLAELFSRKFDVDASGSNSTTCGLFCANVVWLLKQGNMSASLRGRRHVVKACQPVFDETIKSLPNLKLVVAFGKDTFSSACELLGLQLGNWRDVVTNRTVIEVFYKNQTFGLCTVPHPAARGRFRESLSPTEDDPWGGDIISWMSYVQKNDLQ